MTHPLAIVKSRSGNKKIGDAATTYAAQVSCPTSCVFFDGGGCYAESGLISKVATNPLNAGARAEGASALDVAVAEAAAIDAMRDVYGQPMRLHTVGDCKTDEIALIVSAACERFMARGGGQVWTYTHAWRDVDRRSWGKVSVLASCETVDDVVAAQARGYATSIVVEEFPTSVRYPLDGRAFALPCPAQTKDGVSCSSCRLCFDDRALLERGYSIAFEIHGIPYAVRQARAALRDPDDPLRRLTLEQRIRLELEERPGLTPAQAAETLNMSASYAGLLLAHIRDGAEHPSAGRRRRYAERRPL